jgi:hypothetical protein
MLLLDASESHVTLDDTSVIHAVYTDLVGIPGGMTSF